MSKIDLYSDDSMNALYQAILDCANDEYPESSRGPENYHMYTWIEETPRSSMCCRIVNKLRENGWNISPTSD